MSLCVCGSRGQKGEADDGGRRGNCRRWGETATKVNRKGQKSSRQSEDKEAQQIGGGGHRMRHRETPGVQRQ